MVGLFFVGSVSFVILSAVIAVKAVKKGVSGKKAVFSQIGSTFGFVISFFACLASNVHAAAATSSSGASEAVGSSIGVGLIGVGLALGLTAIGAGLAVASAAPAAIAANAENPKTFGKSMGVVAMGEGILIFGVIIAFLMLTKVDQIITLLGA